MKKITFFCFLVCFSTSFTSFSQQPGIVKSNCSEVIISGEVDLREHYIIPLDNAIPLGCTITTDSFLKVLTAIRYLQKKIGGDFVTIQGPFTDNHTFSNLEHGTYRVRSIYISDYVRCSNNSFINLA